MTRFAIVGMGRTGSTLLVDLLGSHPEIECKGELFGPMNAFSNYPQLTRGEFLDQAAYDTDRPIKGFKMPFDWIMEHPGIFDDFESRRYRAILLERQNALDHFLSVKLAALNTDWSSSREYTKQVLSLSPYEFMSFVGIRSYVRTVLNKMCRKLPTHSIIYEELFTPAVRDSLLEFLGAAPSPLLASRTVRARSRMPVDIIENYNELVAFFQDGPYSIWFPAR